MNKREIDDYRKAVTHGTCWTDDTQCNQCTSLPMCNLVKKLLDTIDTLQQENIELRTELETTRYIANMQTEAAIDLQQGLLNYHNPRDIALPEIKKGKTLYVVWDGKMVRFKYKGIGWGCMDEGKFHVVCEMILLEDVTINNHFISKGDERIFYADKLDVVRVFTSRKAAKKALEVEVEQA